MDRRKMVLQVSTDTNELMTIVSLSTGLYDESDQFQLAASLLRKSTRDNLSTL